MNQAMKAQCRRCGGELDPMIDDVERRLCNSCLQEIEDENHYEEYQDEDELDSMLETYEGDW